MALPLFLLVLLVPSFPAGLNQTEPTPRLQLSASTTRPFVDQQVTLTLLIEMPGGRDGVMHDLQIPWLESEFGFQWARPPADWLKERRQATSGQRLRLSGKDAEIRAEEISGSKGRFRLTWTLAVNEPDELQQGVITFSPVRLGFLNKNIASNSLSLQVRKLPLPPADLPRLYLGVGDWRIEAEVREPFIRLGSASLLTLRVVGDGAPTRIARPTPAQLWRDHRFRLEADADGVDARGRWFRYQLHPRIAGPMTLPPLAYACFDPTQERYQQRETKPVALHFRQSAGMSRASVPRPYGDDVPERLRAKRLTTADLEPAADGFPMWLAIVCGALPPLVTLCLWLGRHRLFPQSWPHRGRSLSASALLAIHALRRLHSPPDAERVLAIFTRYLQESHGLPPGEPTPVELRERMRAMGIPEAMSRGTETVVERLAGARFGARGVDGENLVELVELAIRDLEVKP